MESRAAVLHLEKRLRGVQHRLRELDADRSRRGALRGSTIRELLGYGVPMLLSNVFHALLLTDDRCDAHARESFEVLNR